MCVSNRPGQETTERLHAGANGHPHPVENGRKDTMPVMNGLKWMVWNEWSGPASRRRTLEHPAQIRLTNPSTVSPAARQLPKMRENMDPDFFSRAAGATIVVLATGTRTAEPPGVRIASAGTSSIFPDGCPAEVDA